MTIAQIDPSEDPPDILQAALATVALGLIIHPLWWIVPDTLCCACSADGVCWAGKPGKHPLTKWKSQGKATNDPKQVAAYWRRWPLANIGLVTGRPNRIAVVDLDGEEGERSWRELERQHGKVAPTVTSHTGRGRHLVFELPENVTLGSPVGVRPGIDIRCDGGYAVVSPSLHELGHRYRWDEVLGLDAPKAMLPGFVPALVRERKVSQPSPSTPLSLALNSRTSGTDREIRYVRAALANECAAVRGTPEGGHRRNRLNRAALKIGHYIAGEKVGMQEVRDALLDAALACGLEKSRALTTINNGLRDGMAQPRDVPPPKEKHS